MPVLTAEISVPDSGSTAVVVAPLMVAMSILSLGAGSVNVTWWTGLSVGLRSCQAG